MKRKFDPAVLEMMDRPQAVSPELERDLLNLRRLNRYFGGYGLVLHFVRRWIKSDDRLRVLDLATGSGDFPRLIAGLARKVGADVKIDAVDRQPAILEAARYLSGGYPEISYIEADVLDWQSPERYDVVLCTLALHHFSEEDAVKLLRRCCELSRKFVLVSDLRRSWFTRVGVHILTTLVFREPMTRFDGRLSAERAFSFQEMNDLAERAGWTKFGHQGYRFARQAIWLEEA
jgi:2-polyprenyl-3-methyl-5-hydroxy-6-metoxy-1,4-benzoquinol methylase